MATIERAGFGPHSTRELEFKVENGFRFERVTTNRREVLENVR